MGARSSLWPGRVAAEPRARKVRHWLEWTATWAQGAIGEELAAAGVARLERRRFLGLFVPVPHLEILDQAAQDKVTRLVREAAEVDGTASRAAALLVVLLRNAAMLQYHV